MGNHWVCIVCKREGLSLHSSLFRMKKGVTNNMNKHLVAFYKDVMETDLQSNEGK